MKRSVCLAFGALLIIGLYIGTEQPALAFEQQFGQPEGNLISPNTSSFQTSCSTTFQDQAIPDDGSWLQICLMDPNAPDQSTVTEIYVKYQLDHPDPNQLEIRLTRSGTNASETLWNRGNVIQGAKLGETLKLDAFKGTPSQGAWYLSVRDTIPGQTGQLKAASVRAYYAPVGPLPQKMTGTPGRSTSLRIPAGAIKSSTPDADKKKPVTESQSASPLQTTGWQEIKSETFEGYFPGSGWTLIDDSNDGYEYLWDDDDYLPHSGYWAGWPANGGANALDPQYYY